MNATERISLIMCGSAILVLLWIGIYHMDWIDIAFMYVMGIAVIIAGVGLFVFPIHCLLTGIMGEFKKQCLFAKVVFVAMHVTAAVAALWFIITKANEGIS